MHRAASRTSGPQWGALSGRLFALVCSCALVFVLVLAQLLLVARLFFGLLLPLFPVWFHQSPVPAKLRCAEVGPAQPAHTRASMNAARTSCCLPAAPAAPAPRTAAAVNIVCRYTEARRSGGLEDTRPRREDM